ncbi:Programmed cell death protein [Entamoeba marina]
MLPLLQHLCCYNCSYKSLWWWKYIDTLTSHEYHAIERCFVQVDKEKKGTLTTNELMKIKFSNGYQLNKENSTHFIRIFDTKGFDTITYIEFLALYSFLTKCLYYLDLQFLSSKKSLNVNDLKTLFINLDLSLNARCCSALLQKVSVKGNNIDSAIYCCGFVAQLRTVYEQCSLIPFEIDSFSKFVEYTLLLI